MPVKNMPLIKWASLSTIPDAQKVENITFLSGAKPKLSKVEMPFGMASGAKSTLILIFDHEMGYKVNLPLRTRLQSCT